MTSYLSRLGLWLGSLLLVVIANLVACFAALLGSDRAWPVTVANDQALNAALVGRPGSEDETLSSRAGKASLAGRRWGCILCWLLDKIDPGHCDKNIELDEGDPAVSGPSTTTGTPRPRVSRPSSTNF